MTRTLPPLVAIVLAPLLLGIIQRAKAVLGGQSGPPLLQPYYDLRRLLGKGIVESPTTSWVSRWTPIVSLASMLVAAMLMPFGNLPAVFSFPGDLVVFTALLTLSRFFLVSAALDTGTALGGLGASREVFFAMLAEPALLLGLAAVAKAAATSAAAVSPEAPGGAVGLSLWSIHTSVTWQLWGQAGVVLVFVTVALTTVLLAETGRLPVDDPATPYELTTIQESLLFNASGPDLAFARYSAALKLWLLGALLCGLTIPHLKLLWCDVALHLVGMTVVAVVIGLIESTTARLRLNSVPNLLLAAMTLSVLALVLEYRPS